MRSTMRLIQSLVIATLLTAGAAQAQKIKVGYWTSGFSLGFGVVMEQLKFAEKEGLDVEWVKFAEVNGPTRAIVRRPSISPLPRLPLHR